jgi:rhodanese-related sulfurtransferase
MTTRSWIPIVLCALLGAGTSACAKPRPEASKDGAQAEAEPFGHMTVDELDAKMADAKAGKIKLAVFDNNHRERFDKSHIPGATWVQFDKIQASDLPADKDTLLVFYCANEH